MDTLVQKHCRPCEGFEAPLGLAQIKGFLAELPKGWMLSEDAKSISKEFKFDGFRAAQGFVNAAADIAETENHHPNVLWRYNKVKLTHTTHVIKGISENDFILAAKIEVLLHPK